MELIWKFIKFGVVGFSGLGIDFGLTYLLREKARWQQYLANAAGFSCAATSNYFLNRVWTFHSQNPDLFMEYSSFFVVALIGLLVNSSVLWLLVSRFQKEFYFSKFLAIGVTILWNFSANYIYTFDQLS